MALVLKSTETHNSEITGEGLYAFEANMPGSANWTAGLTVDVDIRSPIEADQWETLHTFSDKGSWQTYLVRDRVYRVAASVPGAWVFLNLLRERTTR